MGELVRASADLSKGRMVVLYDGDEREGEADLLIAARYTKPETIETMRTDAGGLICLAIQGPAAERLGLPFMTDVLNSFGDVPADLSCKRTAYGDKPAFSLALNHVDVFTGITDDDRALTITKTDSFVRDEAKTSKEFTNEFYSPGHVFLLISRGIENRRGHTELSLELAKLAGLDGGIVLCEMLGKGKALPKEEAIEYARKHGITFIEGKTINSPHSS